LLFFVCIGACALLSFIFPLDRPLWQRRAYIFLEILLILPTRITEWNFECFLYLFFAKSCFLLKRKDVVITVLTGAIAWELALIVNMSGEIESICSRTPHLCARSRIFFQYMVNDITSLIISTTFVLLFSFVLLSERKNHIKAVALTRQVETLAATLERNRIARDIHDSLGHTLTSLDIQLELAQRLHGINSERALQALNIAKNLSGQSLTEVRRAVSTMREHNFDLNQALIVLTEQFQHDRSLSVDLRLNLPQLPLQTSHQLFCIVREGLTNIQKHSQASRVTIQAETTAELILLKIIDNGIGFDPQLANSGFGLRGMKERVQMLGGTITINSTSGKGTLIQLTLHRNSADS
jgi:signal transduction histidine kinase